MSRRITIISGTNRSNSKTLVVAKYIQANIKKYLPEGSEVTLLDLTELPPEIFSPEVYQKKPSSFDPFRDAAVKTDGIISVLPEYNGSAPGIFKYFIDMLPFPESLKDVPCAFVGLGAGKFGNLRGVEHMQGVFGYRNARLYPYRMFFQDSNNALDNSGAPKEEFVLNLFHEQLEGFSKFIEVCRN